MVAPKRKPVQGRRKFFTTTSFCNNILFSHQKHSFPYGPISGSRKVYLLFRAYCIKLLKLGLIYFLWITTAAAEDSLSWLGLAANRYLQWPCGGSGPLFILFFHLDRG